MEWKVVLKGDETDLQKLVLVLNSPELTIEKENQSYILKSSRFSSLISAQEVREKTSEMLIPVNAGIKIELGASRPIEIVSVLQINPGGIITGTICRSLSFCVRLPNDSFDPHYFLLSLLDIAKTDHQVAKMCQYINQDFNSWIILYKIYEVIKDDGFSSLQEKTKNQLEGKYCKNAALFRRTANNPSSSGLNSRHGVDDVPPENPMSLSESQEFIKMLIREWLDEKRKKMEKCS